MALVGALRLAELLVGAGHVEDVVDDLEQDPELLGEAAVRTHARLVDAGEGERDQDAGPDQAARLQPVELAQPVGVQLLAGGHVAVLASDHAGDAGRRDELPERREHARGIALLALAEMADRLGEEAVAGQDRDVLPVDDVRRRSAPPQLVVVHRRQVVVDQRVGVDELDRGRGGQHLASDPRPPSARWRGTARAGSACRRRAASSASPRRGPRSRRDRRTAARPGSPRPARAGRRGTRSPRVSPRRSRPRETPGRSRCRPG